MNVSAAEIFSLELPFRTSFRHAGKLRRCSDSIVVKLYADDGTVGFGEGVARPYVTGETVTSCLNHMATVLWPSVSRVDYREIDTTLDPVESLAPIAASLPEMNQGEVIAWHGARTAFETALLDLILKRQGLSLAAVLEPVRDHVAYSGVIGLGSLARTAATALYFKRLGVKHFKLKICGRDNLPLRLRVVRALIGRRCSLRLDANEAFVPERVEEALNGIERYDIACVEQPIPRGDPETLARLQRVLPVPLMADESLVTLGDARSLSDVGACEYFNLRLSKCGGVTNTLAIYRLAVAAGIRVQLGCQVGETAILSAVGRHMAAHLDHVEFLEGSYGPRLLVEDLATPPVGFGAGGKASLLQGPGIGVRINEVVLRKYSHQSLKLGRN